MNRVRKDGVEEIKDEIRKTARKEAAVRADKTRQEVGDIVVDKLGEYFPEAVAKRRRRHVASGFVLGVLVGLLVQYIVGER